MDDGRKRMTTNETPAVTQEDREAYDALMSDENYDSALWGPKHFTQHRITSVKAATAEKDAEIARLIVLNRQLCDEMNSLLVSSTKAARMPTPSLCEQLGPIIGELRPKPSCLEAAQRGYFFGYNTGVAERDQLRAKLDEARKVFEEIAIAKGDHPNNSDYTRGWNDARHRLREIACAFPASAPLPEQKAQGAGPPFNFDRYINGVLMAEGVWVEKADTLDAAMVIASRIASRGSDGEVPVLVYRPCAPAPVEAGECGECR